MKIVVIGTGYVGLVSGVCFADMGHNVICVDKDIDKIDGLNQGRTPIFEPGLDELVSKNTKCGNLSFTTSLKSALSNAQVVFIAVGTPENKDSGKADLTYVLQAAKEVAQNARGKILVVTKSTVPVGTGEKISQILSDNINNAEVNDVEFDVASNPEFLREGQALADFMQPDRIIVGVETNSANEIMHNLYAKLIDNGAPILFTNIATAELIKYASNAFLAMKIGYTNEIADICEGVGANIDLTLKGMGLDKRIGSIYMRPGPGYGGSCFPKDTSALTHIANDSGFSTNIIKAVIESNKQRRKLMVNKIIGACGGTVKGKRISVLGLAFKAGTDDVRDSPSIDIIELLIDKGAEISVFDPKAMVSAKKILTNSQINWSDDVMSACENSDAVVILTEWNEFKEINLEMLSLIVNSKLLIDLRNILDKELVLSHGFKYVCVG